MDDHKRLVHGLDHMEGVVYSQFRKSPIGTEPSKMPRRSPALTISLNHFGFEARGNCVPLPAISGAENLFHIHADLFVRAVHIPQSFFHKPLPCCGSVDVQIERAKEALRGLWEAADELTDCQ